MTFREKFAKYEPTDESGELINRIKEFSLRLDKERKMLEIFIQVDGEPAEKRVLYRMEEELCSAYELNSVRIFPKYSSIFVCQHEV